MADRRTARRPKGFGSLYRGREGQWTWIVHRVTGVAIILFLFAHVVDTAVVGWGPEAYNRVISVYHNPFIRLLELGLVAAVIYHALNGAADHGHRLLARRRTTYNRQLIYGTIGLFVAEHDPHHDHHREAHRREVPLMAVDARPAEPSRREATSIRPDARLRHVAAGAPTHRGRRVLVVDVHAGVRHRAAVPGRRPRPDHARARRRAWTG